ncbi:uncharacterized protein LOC116286352 isoform X2 [Actinia tenebrosa]|uniref:Uncharacterized protein LOC116286352 isoform X2 n=1 Tax=Actinia tenebrosa TaxID=6105 RepID=A0A6P8H7I4_ACTTE|nr:uncharacterized protein LOC116286352 isoform X2 [Actinia tenebrosa]XP_031548691.1 uncharacterized protein LOC116286352 isoform X2 [Actinia tenebrosa]XP_031548692.1 uncharacterized protein LOC116286352 isoform X2 [Actinia tenebrosa]
MVFLQKVAACMQVLGLQNQTPIQRRKHYPNYFSKVLKFFENDFSPKGCVCGTTLALHPRKFLEYCKSVNEDITGITENSIRAFVKVNNIGCIGKKMRFRGEGVMTTAIHFSKKWMPVDAIKKLDEKFGTRKKGREEDADSVIVGAVGEISDSGSMKRPKARISSRLATKRKR